MKTRRGWLFLILAAILLAGCYWQFRRRPHDGVAIRGSLLHAVAVVSREQALAEALIDIKLPGIGQIRLPKQSDASAAEISYLKANPSVSGLLRFHKYPGYANPKWMIDGEMASARPEDLAGVIVIPVPYAFGNRPLEVQLHSELNEGVSHVTLPPNGIPVPTVKALSEQMGRVKIKFFPRPILTSLPFVDFDVSMESQGAGRNLALSFSKNEYGWEDQPFHVVEDRPLRLRIPVQFRSLRVSIAEFSRTKTSIVTVERIKGRVQGFTSNRTEIFSVQGSGTRFAPGFGQGTIVFDGGIGRLDNGICAGLIEPSYYNNKPADPMFLKLLQRDRAYPATILTLGKASSRVLNIPRLDRLMFMIDH